MLTPAFTLINVISNRSAQLLCFLSPFDPLQVMAKPAKSQFTISIARLMLTVDVAPNYQVGSYQAPARFISYPLLCRLVLVLCIWREKIYHLFPSVFTSSGGNLNAGLDTSGDGKRKFVSYDTALGATPGMTTCASCQQQVMTNVTYKAGTYAWLMCLLFICCG